MGTRWSVPSAFEGQEEHTDEQQAARARECVERDLHVQVSYELCAPSNPVYTRSFVARPLHDTPASSGPPAEVTRDDHVLIQALSLHCDYAPFGFYDTEGAGDPEPSVEEYLDHVLAWAHNKGTVSSKVPPRPGRRTTDGDEDRRGSVIDDLDSEHPVLARISELLLVLYGDARMEMLEQDIGIHRPFRISTRANSLHPAPECSSLLPIRHVCRTHTMVYIIFDLDSKSSTLERYIHFGMNEFLAYDLPTRFLIYQLVAGLRSLHDIGLVHGNIQPSTIFVSDLMWVHLGVLHAPKLLHRPEAPRYREPEYTPEQWATAITARWAARELSNFEYLLSLNTRAGRRVGDVEHHAIFPWVVDFTGKNRDLSMSKYRLSKGDEMLDLAYEHGDEKCHINEVLSEVSLFTYLARRKPVADLQRHVRAHFEPNEYPSTIQRLYQVSPEECIPQFYCDPEIFISLHPEMPDLGVGDYASDPYDFIRKHREALESEEVSQQLHHWIDLTFGYLLTGPQAIQAKNVARVTNIPKDHHRLASSSAVAIVPQDTSFKGSGFVQLFTLPHPVRQIPDKRATGTSTNTASWSSAREHGVSPYIPLTGSAMAYLGRSSSKDDIHSDAHSTLSTTTTTTTASARTDDTIYLSGIAPTPHTPTKKGDKVPPASGSKRQKFRAMFSSKDKENKEGSASNEKLHGHSSSIDSLLLSQPNPAIVVPEDVSFTRNLGLLEDLSSFVNRYGDGALYSVPVAPSTVEDLHYQFTERRKADLFSVGTVVGEIYTGSPLYSGLSYRARRVQGELPNMSALPSPVQSLLVKLLAPDSTRTSALLSNPFFPSYFGELYEFLKVFHSQITWTDRLTLTFDHLASLLRLPNEGFLLLLPSFLRFFEIDETKLGCLRLLDAIGTKLRGPLSREYLLQPLVALYHETDRIDVQEVLCSATLLQGAARMFGLASFLDHILPCVRLALTAKSNRVAHAASASLVHLAPIFGPPVVVKFVATPLLKQLLAGVIVDSTMVVKVITDLSKYLGEPVVDSHFLPSIVEQLHSNHRQYRESQSSATAKQRNSLMGAFSLIECLLDILSPTVVLRALLVESCFLFDMLLYPFPDHFVFQRLVTVIVRIGKRVGPDNLEKHILPHIDQFFVNYNHYNKETPNARGSGKLGGDLYTKRAVCSVYIQFRDFLGPTAMSHLLPASVEFDNMVEFPEFEDWDDAELRTTDSMHSTASDQYMSGRSRSSSVSWLLSSNFQSNDYAREDDDSWKFEGAILRAFKAHSSVVKALDVQSDEKCFISGGKDGTVKCWHLDREENIMTYTQHREPVFGVRYVNHGRHVASCDHTIHVWDAEKGTTLFTFLGQSDFSCFEHAEEQHALLAGSPELALRFIDLSNGQQVSEWKLPVLPSNIRIGDLSLLPQVTLKTVAIQSNGPYLAAGFSSGQVSLLDQRTGVVVDSFRAHEKEILSLKFHGSDRLLTSAADKSISLWDIRSQSPTIEHSYTGLSDGAHSFALHRECIIAAAGKKIGIAALTERGQEVGEKSKFSTKKLRSPSGSRGAITTLSVLDRTQLIILGFEDGHISFCT